MKILNLYAGIGGNRALWGNEHDITAVEYNHDIAAVYQDLYPNDTVIVGDAHAYLLEHYKEFDFIWASPPCQSHSRILNSQYTKHNYNPKYPDMKLWQEIIFLQGHQRDKKWVVENVIPYYQPLIKPSVELLRHLFWSNFNIPYCEFEDKTVIKYVKGNNGLYGVSLSNYAIGNKRQILRNMVNPEIGKHILDIAMNKSMLIQGGLFEEL